MPKTDENEFILIVSPKLPSGLATGSQEELQGVLTSTFVGKRRSIYGQHPLPPAMNLVTSSSLAALVNSTTAGQTIKEEDAKRDFGSKMDGASEERLNDPTVADVVYAAKKAAAATTDEARRNSVIPPVPAEKTRKDSQLSTSNSSLENSALQSTGKTNAEKTHERRQAQLQRLRNMQKVEDSPATSVPVPEVSITVTPKKQSPRKRTSTMSGVVNEALPRAESLATAEHKRRLSQPAEIHHRANSDTAYDRTPQHESREHVPEEPPLVSESDPVLTDELAVEDDVMNTAFDTLPDPSQETGEDIVDDDSGSLEDVENVDDEDIDYDAIRSVVLDNKVHAGSIPNSHQRPKLLVEDGSVSVKTPERPSFARSLNASSSIRSASTVDPDRPAASLNNRTISNQGTVLDKTAVVSSSVRVKEWRPQSLESADMVIVEAAPEYFQKVPVKSLTQTLTVAQEKARRRVSVFDQIRPDAQPNKPVSALSAMMVKKGEKQNPFAQLYSNFNGQTEANSIKLQIYLPFSEEPLKQLNIAVKSEATVDEVIGYTLFEYFNEGRLPVLTDRQLSASVWSLRIVEDDGSIDDDFPALDRTRKLAKFQFDQFALCEIESSEPASMPTSAKTPSTLHAGSVLQSEHKGSIDAGSVSSTPVVSNAPSVFLKVHLYSTLEVKQTTTMQMPLNIPMSEVFKLICLKRKYELKDYVLKMADVKTDVPLDKTLDQLKATEFCVLKKSSGGAGDIFLRPVEETNQENDEEDKSFLTTEDYRSVYKQFNVIYKQLMGRHERNLTIDGEYVHLVANEKQLFDMGKSTNSYHISSVASCKQVKKQSASFKLVVQRNHDTKVYELESPTSREACIGNLY